MSKVERRQLPGGGMHLGFTMGNGETDPDKDIRVQGNFVFCTALIENKIGI